MSFSHTLKRGWTGPAGTPLEDSETISEAAENNLSESIPGDSTDLAVAWTCDYSALKALYIKSTRDLTIETNSGSAPGNSIALKAGKALIWSLNCGLACPFTVDVTGLFITLAAGVAATLDIRSLVDPTP